MTTLVPCARSKLCERCHNLRFHLQARYKRGTQAKRNVSSKVGHERQAADSTRISGTLQSVSQPQTWQTKPQARLRAPPALPSKDRPHHPSACRHPWPWMRSHTLIARCQHLATHLLRRSQHDPGTRDYLMAAPALSGGEATCDRRELHLQTRQGIGTA